MARSSKKWAHDARLSGEPLPVGAERVAIMVGWAPEPTIPVGVRRTLEALRERDYRVVLVRASEDGGLPDWEDDNIEATVIARPNRGYDFGSWASAFALAPELARTPNLLLLNDSIIGPLDTIDPLIDHFEASNADAWGATSSRQHFAHIQTFFFGFRGGAAASPALREFWRSVRDFGDKDEIVFRMELGLNRALISEGYAVEAFLPTERVSYATLNPTLDRWRDLVAEGFPFIKKSLITDDSEPQRQAEAIEFVSRLCGVDPREWI